MKRAGALSRGSKPLSRRSPLRARPQPRTPRTAPETAWKERTGGFCAVCHAYRHRLHHHHVYPEAKVRMAGGDPWAPANGLYLCERCHLNHHAAFRRIPLPVVPEAALDFVQRLIGEDRALLFFVRHYSAEIPEGDHGWRP